MRSALWKLLKWFLFRFDAEAVHRFSVSLIRLGIALGGLPLRLMSGAPSGVRRVPELASSSSSGVRLWNMDFSSRLGLAAGFDKDAEILGGLPELGFGFAEIGTVTPRPQPGNERPRLFRELGDNAIFNRMGFNSLGATLVAERLRAVRPDLPVGFRIGVNVGKNKETPNEEAAADFALAAKAFEGLADYLVINVSSPNTPGLRALQTVDALKPIVESVNLEASSWNKRPPLLLKLAPELGGEDLRQIIMAAESWGIDGWVLTNTLGGNLDLQGKHPGSTLQGGWSGGPLTEKSRASLVEARKFTRLPVISVGGVLTAEEAAYRIRLGADLVQVYTGWILGGPAFPAKVARALRDIMPASRASS